MLSDKTNSDLLWRDIGPHHEVKRAAQIAVAGVFPTLIVSDNPLAHLVRMWMHEASRELGTVSPSVVVRPRCRCHRTTEREDCLCTSTEFRLHRITLRRAARENVVCIVMGDDELFSAASTMSSRDAIDTIRERPCKRRYISSLVGIKKETLPEQMGYWGWMQCARIANIIADLEDTAAICDKHVEEAIALRWPKELGL